MRPHLAVLCLFIAGSAFAQGPEEREPVNELTVFGGVSILDASGSSERAFSIEDFPDLPDFPFFPGFPGGFPGITLRGGGHLGSSAHFGARYSRRIKDRL
ncbi:MAG TPA: hypothetical protein VJ921_12235, partial [Vicinamibacteria bacterium]|nr:hypothetical protein [Vicinamibacteria bacterium]